MEEGMENRNGQETFDRKQLDYVFNPRYVAVIGASNRIGTWDAGILTRLLGNPERKCIYFRSKPSV